MRIIIVISLILLTMPRNNYSEPGILFSEINELQNTIINDKAIEDFFAKIQQTSETKQIDVKDISYKTQYTDVYADDQYNKTMFLHEWNEDIVHESLLVPGNMDSIYSEEDYAVNVGPPLPCQANYKGSFYPSTIFYDEYNEYLSTFF